MRFEGACACTVGAFHKRNPTFLKSLEVNGNDPRKRAFGCLRRLRYSLLNLILGRRLGVPCLVHLDAQCQSRLLSRGSKGKDLLCFQLACLFVTIGL
jgi:hypothetical protein